MRHGTKVVSLDTYSTRTQAQRNYTAARTKHFIPIGSASSNWSLKYAKTNPAACGNKHYDLQKWIIEWAEGKKEVGGIAEETAAAQPQIGLSKNKSERKKRITRKQCTYRLELQPRAAFCDKFGP